MSLRTAIPWLLAFSAAWPAEAQGRRAQPEAPSGAALPWRRLASLRVMGGAVHISGDGTNDAIRWAFDMHVGLRLAVPSHRPGMYWLFGGDVGVSFAPRGNETPALWLGGLSVGAGNLWVSLAWSPRFVFGSLPEGTALGLRNTLSVCTFLGLTCLDASHQYLSAEGRDQQDIRVAFGIDVGMLAQLLVQFADARPG